MVKYSTPEAKSSSNIFQNISGTYLTLEIKKHDNCLNVIVKTHWRKSIYLICSLLLLLITCISWLFSFNFFILFTAILFIGFLYQMSNNIREESIMIVKNLGYQISSKYLFYNKSITVPFNDIKQVAINEVILNKEFIYVLILLQKQYNELRILPLFLSTKPRLHVLEIIYKHIMEIMEKS